MNSRIIKHLEETGDTGTGDEFKDALLKFGADDKAVEALYKGLAKAERRDSYCDYRTQETGHIEKKRKLIQDFDMRRGPFSDFNAAAAPAIPQAAAKDNRISELQKQVADLTARIEELEARPSVRLMQPIKMKKTS